MLKETGLLFLRMYKFGKWTFYDKNGKLKRTQEIKETEWVLQNEY